MQSTQRHVGAVLLLFTGLLGLATLPAFLRAEAVLGETFASALDPEQWAIFPKETAKALEGVLTLTAEGPESAYAFAMVTARRPLPSLNFLRNDVEIKLTDLDLKGSAAAASRVFLLRIGSDSVEDDKYTGRVQLRVDGAGHFWLTVSRRGEAAPLLEGSGSATLPFKSLKLTLKASGATLSWSDASGEKEQQFSFKERPAEWESAVPWLRLLSQRTAVTGDGVVTLGGFTIMAVPSTSAK